MGNCGKGAFLLTSLIKKLIAVLIVVAVSDISWPGHCIGMKKYFSQGLTISFLALSYISTHSDTCNLSSIMLLSVFLIVGVLRVKKAESVGLYGDCTGGKPCDSGLKCYAEHQYYSQCRQDCPSSWLCSNGGGGGGNLTPTLAPATGNAKALSNDCSFGFGASFDSNRDYSQLDYATIWIGTISP